MARAKTDDSTTAPSPRPPTSQERADLLLMRYRLQRNAGIPVHLIDLREGDGQ